jgi:2-methylcitrate dehydratase PrpD
MEITRRMASFVVETHYAIFPRAAIDNCKANILDYLGVALAGIKTEAGRIIMEYARENGGAGAAGILGGRLQTSPSMAALVNGVLGHALDYDDLNWSLKGHPSVPLLPALFAVGENRKASGKELITSYILGYEIEAKIGLGVNPEHYDRGWHSTATLGTFGALAGVAKLLDLDERQVRMAFGIGASLAGGLVRNFGTMTKLLQVGNAARNGVGASSLARKGFTADGAILEAPGGVLEIFSPQKAEWGKVLDSLGNPFDIVDPGTGLKPYPCCAGGHPAIDAVLDLAGRHRFSADDVEKVECGVHRRTTEAMFHHRPRTGLEGKFSLPYCIWAAILDGKVGLEQFGDSKVEDPKVQELLPRVAVFIHPEVQTEESYSNRFTEITIHLRSGEVLRQRVYTPLGNPKNPLSVEMREKKFAECTKGILADADRDRVLKIVNGLEEVKNIGELMQMLVFKTL